MNQLPPDSFDSHHEYGQKALCNVCRSDEGCERLKITGSCNWRPSTGTKPLSVVSERQYCDCEHGVCAGMPSPPGAQCLSAILPEDFKLKPSTKNPAPDDILRTMAGTFEERGKIYGDNWKRIGAVLHALAGGQPVTIEGEEAWLRWSLYMLMVTKITRLATTDLQHIDSVHDLAVYGAMLESVLQSQQAEKGTK